MRSTETGAPEAVTVPDDTTAGHVEIADALGDHTHGFAEFLFIRGRRCATRDHDASTAEGGLECLRRDHVLGMLDENDLMFLTRCILTI